MKDLAHSRPSSIRSGITSAITAPATLHSHSSSISSFTDLSASSTNVYSSHSRRVRSVRKLRQMLGPEDESSGVTERMEFFKDKDLPLTPSSPSSSRIPMPPKNESTLSLDSSLSNIPSDEDDEDADDGEALDKSASLVYARRVKLEKLKRRLGEDVPRELIFYDHQSSPSSPMSNHKGRSLSLSTVMTFADHERSPRGHTKNAISVSNVGSSNDVTVKRSKAMLRLWKPKFRPDHTDIQETEADGQNTDDADPAHETDGVTGSLNTKDETPYPIQLTSLAGSEWSFSKGKHKGSGSESFDKNTAMHSQFDTVHGKSDLEGIQGVQVVRSRNTIIVEKTSEDDERMHFSSEVEPLRKSMLPSPASVRKFPVEKRQLGSLYSPSLGNDHDKGLSSDGDNTPSPPAYNLRKTRSAVALASESRIQATASDNDTPPLPPTSSSQQRRDEDFPFASTSTSQHSSPRRRYGHTRGETTIWGDENLISEDDRQTGRTARREMKPKGPRPSSRPRPRTAEDNAKFPTSANSDEALESWLLLDQQPKPTSSSSDRPSLDSSSSSSNSLPVSTQNSTGRLPRKANSDPPTTQKTPPTTVPAASSLSKSSSPPKAMASVVYFYHRGVVRLVVEEGAKGPKTMQTVHMRDVLNYLREMRYVH